MISMWSSRSRVSLFSFFGGFFFRVWMLTWGLLGASVYLVRRILLDYPDTMATGILRQLAAAMSADNPKARVLIVEERLSEPPVATNRIVDTMMLNLGGKLRNREMMTEVAEAAGLKVVGYHVKGSNPMYVMECAKA
jgi:hypothetical protein